MFQKRSFLKQGVRLIKSNENLHKKCPKTLFLLKCSDTITKNRFRNKKICSSDRQESQH
mgnify:CR=1 FL=1